MKNKKIQENEIRTLNINNLQTRAKEKSGTQIQGYAVVYDEFTEITDLWGDKFHERISKDAFKNTLSKGHDIFALKNHNWDKVIGRTNSNLTLQSHEKGLFFELITPNTTLGKDIMEEVKSGLINQCSFGFRVLDQEWEERDNEWFRTIKEVELFEITLTPIPAYSSTSAEVRNLIANPTKSNFMREQEERKIILEGANRVYKTLKIN